MYFIEAVEMLCFVLNMTRSKREGVVVYNTHTVLSGFDIRKRRTTEPRRTTAINSFHSPEVIWSPPVGWLLVRLGPNPFDATALRSSASKWSPRGCGNRCDVANRGFEVSGGSGGGDTGRLALKLPDIEGPVCIGCGKGLRERPSPVTTSRRGVRKRQAPEQSFWNIHLL